MNDDLISRRDAIDAVTWTLSRIESRKKGEWKDVAAANHTIFMQCSLCDAMREYKGFYERFCPNCGADMMEVNNV